MHDTLSPEAHGLIDYVTVVAFALAPTLFQFDGVPALIAYGLAGAHLVLTLATRFPMGLFAGVPLRAHGVLELVVSVGLIILPWVAGFVQPGAQWFFPVMGMLVFVVWLLSDYGPSEPVGELPTEPTLGAARGSPPGPGAAEDEAALPRGAPPGTRVSEDDGCPRAAPEAEESADGPGEEAGSDDSESKDPASD